MEVTCISTAQKHAILPDLLDVWPIQWSVSLSMEAKTQGFFLGGRLINRGLTMQFLMETCMKKHETTDSPNPSGLVCRRDVNKGSATCWAFQSESQKNKKYIVSAGKIE